MLGKRRELLPNTEYVFFFPEEIYPSLVSFRIDFRKKLELSFLNVLLFLIHAA